ncbi:uncharacterized protein LOC131246745 isoform X2 [Magnolia sinica]|uniref:uncharacterized protein LOC131246745 isoform X2 n=1 Tax=Magnolia sinica TaxID=86752 RepID=UPI00265A0A3C|nr:uncharacterized protein LOC131246745 isoform X2 [Magnolia sinica]
MSECNRDEATRAKEIAERKFTAKDIAAAKKFALKAHNLYPTLEGLSQMIATFDVYLASENKISGEVDWYAILNVNANADDDTVKKQYRKLALTLHPDKNKSIGAEGAFKLLSEAWSVLSDKTRRSTYDQKRNNVKAHQQKAQQQNKNSSAPNANGFGNFAKTGTASNARPPKNAARTTPTAAPTPSRPVKPNTFWTACNRCKMQYEYLRVYLNHNLLCPNCHEPFLAVETATPSNGSNASVTFSFPQQRQQNANKNAHAVGRNTSAVPNVGYTHHTNFQWGPFSRTAGVASATASSSAAAQAANVVHHTYEKVRREREEAQAAARKEESHRRKGSRRQASGSVAVPHSNAASSGTVVDRERPVSRAERVAKRRRGIEEDADGLIRDQSLFETRTSLMEKARMEIRKKLNEWSLAAAAKVAEKEKATATINVDACHPKISDAALNNKEPKKAADSNTAPRQPLSIVVPNPDFHEFDNDRTGASFEASQVWAAYDDDDGMPRFYALIHKVVSLKPFKMRFSWLNSKTNSELGPLNWVASGFTKTCGEFRVGRYELNNNVNIFSHKVRWEKGTRGVVKIMPKKGDIWALYRHWSPDWSETTPDAVIHKYDMVEVLEDYSEEGVSVTPLVKVAGFKTVFCQHPDPSMVTRIPREEMFRFSHQVPSWLLTGEEAENAPKGCRELDPAATPLELLQIITETKEEKRVENTILLHQVVTEPKEAKVVENTVLLHQVVTEPKEPKVVESAEHLQVESEITAHLQVKTEIKEEKVVENTKLLPVEVDIMEEVVENAELPQVITQLKEEKVVEIKEEKAVETAERQQ